MAKLIPIQKNTQSSPFGCGKDDVLLVGDLLNPFGEKWDADEN